MKSMEDRRVIRSHCHIADVTSPERDLSLTRTSVRPRSMAIIVNMEEKEMKEMRPEKPPRETAEALFPATGGRGLTYSLATVHSPLSEAAFTS